MIVYNQCSKCANYITQKKCFAFPYGIPNDIWFDKIKHDKPMEGDKGIIYEDIKDEE